MGLMDNMCGTKCITGESIIRSSYIYSQIGETKLRRLHSCMLVVWLIATGNTMPSLAWSRVESVNHPLPWLTTVVRNSGYFKNRILHRHWKSAQIASLDPILQAKETWTTNHPADSVLKGIHHISWYHHVVSNVEYVAFTPFTLLVNCYCDLLDVGLLLYLECTENIWT